MLQNKIKTILFEFYYSQKIEGKTIFNWPLTCEILLVFEALFDLHNQFQKLKSRISKLV
jgi:hypothetical protein